MAGVRGRPRASASPTGLTTEQDIRLAAARLFCTEGYGSTSTYAIARAAGISQAGMYHHFAGKHEILLALLLETVRPSVELCEELGRRSEPAAGRLWALCAYDTRLLVSGDDNLGALYLLPELSDPRFAPFHVERQRLLDGYRDLVAATLGSAGRGQSGNADLHGLTSLVFGLVESVILRRRSEPGLVAGDVDVRIADAALRLLGLDDDAVRRARADAPTPG